MANAQAGASMERHVNRRALLTGIGALLAAPAIVRASSLMPIKAIDPSEMWVEDFGRYYQLALARSFNEFKTMHAYRVLNGTHQT